MEQGSLAAMGWPLAVTSNDFTIVRVNNLNIQIRFRLPLVLDVTHEQCTIELDATSGKVFLIGEAARIFFLDLQRLNPPRPGFQLEAIQ